MAGTSRYRIAAGLLALVLAGMPAIVARAQEDAAPGTEPAAPAGTDVEALSRQRGQTAEELEALAEQIELSQSRQEELESEVAALRKDETTLRESLVETADRQRALAEEIAAAEARYIELKSREAGIQSSLAERRDVLAEVLAGLQRLGRNPPPALLVSADDALASVRSAILLGSVVPEMRRRTERLVADLEKLVAVREEIDAERTDLRDAHRRQAESEVRLTLLLDEKEKLQSRRSEELAREREEASRLAERATTLEDLIGSLEAEIASVRDAAEEARKATRLREQKSEEQMERVREMARRGELDANRFAPVVAFDALKGALRMPVEGEVVQAFGADDGTGHELQGMMVSTSSGALVQAPADGWVVYAGPFRSYGQLLIMNAGDEYHVVMAGMDRIDVSPGQFVVAGEPVAEMGATRLAGAAALALASSQPTLYIEFRNDGRPVDPAPWWANDISGRVSNDS